MKKPNKDQYKKILKLTEKAIHFHNDNERKENINVIKDLADAMIKSINNGDELLKK